MLQRRQERTSERQSSVEGEEKDDDEEEESRARQLKIAETMRSHEFAFVDMLRSGILTLQMLPENSSSGKSFSYHSDFIF